MAGAGEGGEEERHLVGRVQGYPRDLLRQFSGGVAVPEEAPAAASGGTEEDSGEIELSLGLSLGGYFGVDPARRRGLHRSSSIATIPLLQQQQEDDHAVSPPLKRTTSLPAEVEEEQRKRKEQQCLRRMEAKRKKSEKTNGSHPWARDPPAASPEEEGEGVPGWMRRPGTEQLDGWWAPNRVATRGGAAAAVEGTRGFAAASQGSVGSQGSSSSRASDSGSRPPKIEGRNVQVGRKRKGETVITENMRNFSTQSRTSEEETKELQNNGTDLWRSSSRTQPLLDLGEHKAPAVEKPAKNSAAAREEEDVEAPCKEPPPAAGGMSRRNGLKGAMEEMPCVSTRGVGPDGKLVEGFLYRYGKGEEVRIVCVCHGSFLSPSEFVRHAGGGDVAHPLRHIIVNPSPSCFL